MAVRTALLLTYLHNGERYMSDKSKEISTEVANSILIEAKAKRKENRQLLLISTISVLVFLGIWELAVRVGWIDSKYLCAPTTVVKTFIQKLSDPKPDGAVLGVHIKMCIRDRVLERSGNLGRPGRPDEHRHHRKCGAGRHLREHPGHQRAEDAGSRHGNPGSGGGGRPGRHSGGRQEPDRQCERCV